MSDLAVNSSLLVAALDLNLVTSVINAIRTADLTSAAEAGSGAAQAVGSRSPSSTPSVQPTGYVRNSEKPAATFESRRACPVHHWHTTPGELQTSTCTRSVEPTDCKLKIQPPWRVLPWPVTARPMLPPGYRMTKKQSSRADLDNVGRTLDLFI